MTEHQAEVAATVIVPPRSATLVRRMPMTVDHEIVLRLVILALAGPQEICDRCPFRVVCGHIDETDS